MTPTRLVISGSIAIDRIMNFSGKYKDLIESSKLEVLSVSVLVNSLKVSPGGTGANIAYNLALMGDKPTLLGAVGTDASDYMQRLDNCGVDISAVHYSQTPTASFSVLTDSYDSQVGGFYPGAMADSESLSVLQHVEPGADVLVCVSAHDPAAMQRQVAECSHNGLRLFYDLGQQVSNIPAEDIKSGVLAAEVVIVNDYELSVLSAKTGMTVEELQAQVPVLISTHGKDGSVISGTKLLEPVIIAASKPVEVVDPTGAGDAYRSGFLYGYLRQWDVRICGQLGSVVASFILEQAGTQIDLSLDAIRQRYQETYNEEINL